MSDWVITLPSKVEWHEYEKELDAAFDEKFVLNFRVPRNFKSAQPGDRIFVVHRSWVKGWQKCVGILRREKPFMCETTFQFWPEGTYLQRSGPFEELLYPRWMKGFQGCRRYTFEEKS